MKNFKFIFEGVCSPPLIGNDECIIGPTKPCIAISVTNLDKTETIAAHLDFSSDPKTLIQYIQQVWVEAQNLKINLYTVKDSNYAIQERNIRISAQACWQGRSQEDELEYLESLFKDAFKNIQIKLNKKLDILDDITHYANKKSNQSLYQTVNAKGEIKPLFIEDFISELNIEKLKEFFIPFFLFNNFYTSDTDDIHAKFFSTDEREQILQKNRCFNVLTQMLRKLYDIKMQQVLGRPRIDPAFETLSNFGYAHNKLVNYFVDFNYDPSLPIFHAFCAEISDADLNYTMQADTTWQLDHIITDYESFKISYEPDVYVLTFFDSVKVKASSALLEALSKEYTSCSSMNIPDKASAVKDFFSQIEKAKKTYLKSLNLQKDVIETPPFPSKEGFCPFL